MAGEAVTMAGKGIDAGPAQYVRCNRSPVRAVGTVGDLCWQHPIGVPGHAFGIPGLLGSSGAKPRRTAKCPDAPDRRVRSREPLG